MADEKDKNIKSYESMFKWIAGIIGVALIGFLIILKIVRPEFPLTWVLILGVAVIVVFAGIYFSFDIFRKLKDKKPAKEASQSISLEQAESLAISAIKSPKYCDYIEKGIISDRIFHVGKNREPIYYLRAKGVYENSSEYVVLINMIYPNEKRTVLINPNQTELTKAINFLPAIPEDTPDTEEIIEQNPLLQTERRIKRIKAVKTKENEKEKEDSL